MTILAFNTKTATEQKRANGAELQVGDVLAFSLPGQKVGPNCKVLRKTDTTVYVVTNAENTEPDATITIEADGSLSFAGAPVQMHNPIVMLGQTSMSAQGFDNEVEG